MKAFIAVADAGGFSSAARHTGQSKALLSKYVGQLEADLELRLFNRNTRHISLSDMGHDYYLHCQPLVEELEALEARIKDRQFVARGKLKISAALSFSEIHLMPLIADFCHDFAHIEIDLVLSDRHVDLIREGYDLAIRIGQLPDSNLIAQKICDVRNVVCATPAYLAQYGRPAHPLALKQHRMIIDSNVKFGQGYVFSDNGKELKVTPEGQIHVNSAVAVRNLALAGYGVAVVPDFVISDAIKSQALELILDAYPMPVYGVYAVYPHRRYLSKKVQVFIDRLKLSFANGLSVHQ